MGDGQFGRQRWVSADFSDARSSVPRSGQLERSTATAACTDTPNGDVFSVLPVRGPTVRHTLTEQLSSHLKLLNSQEEILACYSSPLFSGRKALRYS
jgi:hypothetical protein